MATSGSPGLIRDRPTNIPCEELLLAVKIWWPKRGTLLLTKAETFSVREVAIGHCGVSTT